MIAYETAIEGVRILEQEPHRDERGTFSRIYCADVFAERGMFSGVAQVNISTNDLKGTVRGMHYQAPPHEEEKLVCCVRGGIYDVALDLRESPATKGKWHAEILSESNGRMLHIPKGVAHGYQTLEDRTVVVYLMSHPYHPAAARIVCHDDKRFGIAWPLPVSTISEKDRTL